MVRNLPRAHSVEFEGFGASDVRGLCDQTCTTEGPTVTSGKLTVDERVVLHRVASRNRQMVGDLQWNPIYHFTPPLQRRGVADRHAECILGRCGCGSRASLCAMYQNVYYRGVQIFASETWDVSDDKVLLF